MTILIAVLLSLIGPNSMQDRAQSPIPPKEHIQGLIKMLPPGSKVRSTLESGHYGDGIYHSWMEKMREQGVKRATVVFDFTWHNHPIDLKPDHILFFDKYNSDCSQITDPEHLAQIRQSGLEEALEEFARKATEKSRWFFVDKKPRSKRGQSRVEVADDPWLPTSPPILKPVEESTKPSLTAIVAFGDLAGLQAILKSEHFPAAELDKALFVASGVDDSCLITALLQAGANPNVQNSEGKTPLMYAAGFGSGSAVRALLAGGANAQIKDRAGKSATFFAEQAAHSNIVQLLRSVDK